MKKNMRFLKIAIACLLMIVTVFAFTACGNSTPKASDTNGNFGSINWNYTSSDQTLTISGSGDIPSSASASEVSWAAIRESVVTVKFVGSADSGGVTSIGDYAFYYMPNLKNIELPAKVTNIGKSAFAFCTSIENITIPNGVTTVGERAFEGCSALKSVALPASVNAVGNSAFAYCTAMTDLTIVGELALPEYAFRNCKALTVLAVSDSVTAQANTFEGAGKSIDSAEKIGEEGTITVKYVLEDGTTNAFSESKDISEVKKLGESYSYTSPDKEGYIPDMAVVQGVSAGKDKEFIVKYTKKAEETTDTSAVTEAPAQTEAPTDDGEEGITTGTIIAIVIMGVVIVGIIVGAVLLMRPNKNDNAKNSKGSSKSNTNNKK